MAGVRPRVRVSATRRPSGRAVVGGGSEARRAAAAAAAELEAAAGTGVFCGAPG